jgi:hypothetical protein
MMNQLTGRMDHHHALRNGQGLPCQLAKGKFTGILVISQSEQIPGLPRPKMDIQTDYGEFREALALLPEGGELRDRIHVEHPREGRRNFEDRGYNEIIWLDESHSGRIRGIIQYLDNDSQDIREFRDQ